MERKLAWPVETAIDKPGEGEASSGRGMGATKEDRQMAAKVKLAERLAAHRMVS